MASHLLSVILLSKKNTGLMWIGPLKTYFSEIVIEAPQI